MNDIDRGGRPAVGPKVPINFPAEQLAKVDELAREAGTTRAAWIRQAVEDAIQREEAASNLRVTVYDVRKLLAYEGQEPVLYVNVEDGPAHIDVWTSAHVQPTWRIASYDYVTELIGGDPSDSEIRSILDDLQEYVDAIDL